MRACVVCTFAGVGIHPATGMAPCVSSAFSYQARVARRRKAVIAFNDSSIFRDTTDAGSAVIKGGGPTTCSCIDTYCFDGYIQTDRQTDRHPKRMGRSINHT